MPSSTHRSPGCEQGYTRSAGPAWRRCGLHGVPRGRLGPGEVDTAASPSASSVVDAGPQASVLFIHEEEARGGK